LRNENDCDEKKNDRKIFAVKDCNLIDQSHSARHCNINQPGFFEGELADASNGTMSIDKKGKKKTIRWYIEI